MSTVLLEEPTQPAATAPLELNADQQAAAEAFFAFLMSDEKEFSISGPGGVGKTFLMAHMIDAIIPYYHQTCRLMGIPPRYSEVVMTATTNKAASVLADSTKRPTSTIHSFMNLKIENNFSNGRSYVTKQRTWKIHQDVVLFIDETSMIDTPLDNLIQEGTHNCKLVYVGDHCQMAPVMESLSPIYKRSMPFFHLTKQMRNSGQPALVALCEQLRETVQTGIFEPIKIVPGVIDYLDDDAMEHHIKRDFLKQNTNTRILAYTNSRVQQYNDYIRGIRNLPDEYQVGDMLVNNSAIRMPSRMLAVEEELSVIRQEKNTQMIVLPDQGFLEVRESVLLSSLGDTFTDVMVPVDRAHYAALVAFYKRSKDWSTYFELKERYPDLRPRDASTVYKAQGSTYDTVYIDLSDISTCRNADQVARMLNVAASRARSRIYLYGDLAQKYGGLIS